jgi:hypothetical protein
MATINHKTYNEATETFKDFSVYDGKETLIFKVDGADQTVYASNIIGSGIIKTSDNGPLSATAKYLSDGLGNNSVLAVSTTAVGIGTATPAGRLSVEATGNHLTVRASTAAAGKYWALDVTAANQLYIINNAGTQYLTITDAGKVGIGTTSPSQLLHINASSGAVYTRVQNNVNSLYLGVESGGIAQVSSDASSLKVMANTFTSFETAAAERMRITSTGNVGIGTSSPAAKLDVAFPSSGTGAVFGYMGGTNNPRIFFNVNESTSKGQIIMSGSSGALDLGIGAGGTEIITLKGTGNVGIGTSAPTSKLHVQGTSYFFDQSIFGDKVGIGTSSPASRLHVQNGALQVSGNSIDTIVSYSTVGIVGTATAHDLQIVRNGAEICRVTANGLTFNGDTAAANALDDYEEGTFTATITPATSGTITSGGTFTTWTYTKIGRQVTISGVFVISSVASPVGANVIIGGLPFTIFNNNGAYGAFSAAYFTFATSADSAVAGRHSVNTTQLTLGVDASTVAASDEIYVTATYFV